MWIVSGVICVKHMLVQIHGLIYFYLVIFVYKSFSIRLNVRLILINCIIFYWFLVLIHDFIWYLCSNGQCTAARDPYKNSVIGLARWTVLCLLIYFVIATDLGYLQGIKLDWCNAMGNTACLFWQVCFVISF